MSYNLSAWYEAHKHKRLSRKDWEYALYAHLEEVRDFMAENPRVVCKICRTFLRDSMAEMIIRRVLERRR